MSEAFIIWYSFVSIVCAIIAIRIDNRDMEKKDKEIKSLRLENKSLKDINDRMESKIKFMEHSSYYEEL